MKIIYSNAKRAATWEVRGRKAATWEVAQYSGSSFSDLPRDILVNILLWLPVKSIVVSKSVCKTWYELISDPEFANLHFDQSEVYPLVQRLGWKMACLVQPDKADFEVKLGMCDHCFFKPGCVCNVNVKLDTNFEIPDRSESVKLGTNHKYSSYCIVNSCNGLLCLVTAYYKNFPIVCNPITCEFVNLPVLESKHRIREIQYGFGFSPTTNQYKVIRMFQHGGTRFADMPDAEVLILGTKKWKHIGSFESMPKSFPIYLNGFLYGFSGGQPLSLISFDIGKECFELVSVPAADKPCKFDSVGVLGGELCISGVLKSGTLHVWTKKDYSTEKAWSKVFSFDLNSFGARHSGPFQPIKYLNDGALLMFYSHTNALIYMDPKTNRMRCLKVRGGIESLISHIPSFVSLKHALSGLNVKMLNVKPRCGKLKRRGGIKDIDLVEQEFYPGHDSYYSSDYDSDY